jgi:hypothetical protein
LALSGVFLNIFLWNFLDFSCSFWNFLEYS